MLILLTMTMININFSKKLVNESYLPYIEDQRQTQIFFGGSSSGKSYFLLGQRTVLDLLKGGRNFLIIRNVAGSNKHSTFNEIQKGIITMGLTKEFTVRSSDMTITCKNGYQAIFKGLDDIEKVKSITPLVGSLTDVVIEEATETVFEKVKQLTKRMRGKTKSSKRLTLLFNPIYKTHWIYKTYFAGRFKDTDKMYQDDRMLIVKTTYKDNLRFLGPDEVFDLENETNEYFKNVYTYGNWGILGDLVYTNWKTQDLSDVLETGNGYRNGLDFGFSNHPCALSRSWMRGNQIFITHCPDEIYQTHIHNDILYQRCKKYIGGEIVTADSAAPLNIDALKLLGLNVIEAKKGKDSVNLGIQWLQGKEIIVHNKLQNAINEFSMYQWSKNKDGESINDPVKKHDHFLDALRYSYERDMVGGYARAMKVKF